MAKSGRSRGSVAIDTVPLPEKVIGMPTKRGIVRKQRDRYYVAVENRKVEIPATAILDGKGINEMVDQDVYVVFSTQRPSQIVAIGTWPTPERPRIKKRWIICYIPVPDIIKVIQPAVRDVLLNKMVNEGIITKGLAKEARLAGRW